MKFKVVLALILVLALIGVASAYTIIDDFEDGDIAEYGGNTTIFTVNNSAEAVSGSYMLEGISTTNNDGISSTSGLNSYPSQGDIFVTYFKGNQIDPSSGGGHRLLFATQSNTSSAPNGYWIKPLFQSAGGELTITIREGGNNYELSSVSQDFEAGVWYKLKINWTTDGDITATVYHGNGTQIAQTSANDGTYTSGGIGFWYGTNDESDRFNWDNTTILPGVDNPPSVNFEPDTTTLKIHDQHHIFANVTASDDNSVSNVTIYLENETWSESHTDTTSPTQYDYNFTGLSYDNYTLKAWAYDTSQKSSNITRNITLQEITFIDKWINTTSEWDCIKSNTNKLITEYDQLRVWGDNFSGTFNSSVEQAPNSTYRNLSISTHSLSKFHRQGEYVNISGLGGASDARLFINHTRWPNYPYRLTVNDGIAGQDVYKTAVMNRSGWTQIANDISGSKRYACYFNGSHYIKYLNDFEVQTAESLTGPWTSHGTTSPVMNEQTGFYESQTDTYYMYAENNTDCPYANSGYQISLWTSPNGIDSWSSKQVMFNVSQRFPDKELCTGDPQFSRVGEWNILFVDNSTGPHPEYEIGVYVSKEMDTNWTFIGNAMTHRTDNTYMDDYGIQDPTVKYDSATDKFWMATNGHPGGASSSQGVCLYSSGTNLLKARLGLDTTGDNSVDSYTNYKEIISNYGFVTGTHGQVTSVTQKDNVTFGSSTENVSVEFDVRGAPAVDSFELTSTIGAICGYTSGSGDWIVDTPTVCKQDVQVDAGHKLICEDTLTMLNATVTADGFESRTTVPLVCAGKGTCAVFS